MLWLLAHGEALSWLIAALSVLLGVAAPWWLVRRRARREARAVREKWPRPPEALERAVGGEVTVAGVLRSDGDAVLSAASDGFWIEAGQERVHLEQAVPVAGALEHRPRWRAPAAAQTLHSGDRVLARGRLAARGEGGDAYRELTTRLVLCAASEEETVPVAFAEDPRVRGPGWKSHAWGGVVGAVLFSLIGFLGGGVSHEIALARHYDDPLAPERVLPFAAVAAAAPFHRDDAMALAARALYPDSPSRARFAELAADLEQSLVGRCAGVLEALVDHAELHRVADVAERCGDPASLRTGARAALLAGDFERAAELASRAPAGDAEALWTDVWIHLLGGDHPRAAEALRAVAEVEEDSEARATLLCLAESEAIHAQGDDAGLEPLEEGGGACKLLYLDHYPAGDRWALFLVDEVPHDFRLEPLADVLGMEAGTDITLPVAMPFDYPTDLAVGRVLRERAPLGLDAAAVEALEGRELGAGVRASRAAVASRLAFFLAVMGDTDRARTLLDAAQRDLEHVREQRGDQFEYGRALALLPVRRAAVELRAGDLEAARRHLASVEAAAIDQHVAGSRPVRELGAVLDYVERRDVQVFDPEGDMDSFGEESAEQLAVEGLRIAAGTRDGRELVRWLRVRRRYLTTPVAVLGARHVTEHREALVEWLRWDEHAPFCPTMRECRFDALAADYQSRAIAAPALGAYDLAERLDRQAAAFREALLRRDLAIPWALLQR